MVIDISGGGFFLTSYEDGVPFDFDYRTLMNPDYPDQVDETAYYVFFVVAGCDAK